MTKFVFIASAVSTAALQVAFSSVALAQASLPAVEVTASPLRQVSRQEAKEIAGLYWMNDGRLMRLTSQSGAIVANLEGEPTVRLLAVKADELQSEDGRVQMRFAADPARGTSDVKVTLLEPGTAVRRPSGTTAGR
jgi:hypothetical protein